MAESRTSSGRYLAPALVACAAAAAPHSAPQAAELTIDRLFDAPALAGPSIVGLKISPDGSRVTYLQGQAGGQGSARSLGIRHPRAPRANPRRLEGAGAGRRRSSRMRSSAAASGREPRRCPASWNTPSRRPGVRCCFRWTGGCTTTISPNPRRRRCCKSRTPRASRRMRRSHRAAATSPMCATRICMPTISPPAPRRH